MYKSIGTEHYGNVRCSICNKVSSAELIDDTSDYSPNTFHRERDGISLICSECHSEIQEIKSIWDIEDELK